MPSSGVWRRIDVVDWTDVSEDRIASIFRVEISANEEPAWAGGCRTVIEVDALGRLLFIWTALPTVITLITIISLGTYNTSSWYIFLSRRCDPTSPSLFFDDRSLSAWVFWLGCFTGLLLSLTGLLASFSHCFLVSSASFSLLFLFYSGPFTDCSPFITLYSLHREHHVQLFRCWLNAFNCCESWPPIRWAIS
jgi:hypothetical protein